MPHSLASAPYIGTRDQKEVTIAGKPFHLFELPGPSSSYLLRFYLCISEVTEGFPSQAFQMLLAHIRRSDRDPMLPEFIWLRNDEILGTHPRAITPVSLQDALEFWHRQALADNPWAKQVVRHQYELERLIYDAFQFPEAGDIEEIAAWTENCDGGLRVKAAVRR